jgi:DNA-binding PucR family transcriptional regulator
VVRYLDHAVFLSVLRDDLLTTSLRRSFLEPLTKDRDKGTTARETLRAYFDAEQNISSAAAALGVNRQTVAGRLRAIGERIGGHLSVNSPEMQMALGVEEFEAEDDTVGD